jgi:hypothetical protein
MTAGNNGASTPEDDDPFGYLYEDGQAAGAQQRRQGGYGYPGPVAQPGVPRTSYNQVRTVGERQYGQQQVPQQQGQQYGQQQPQQAPYGQQPPYGQAPPGQQPSAAPETSGQGGHATRQVPAQRGGGRGRGPNTKGLLIGAVAVVAVVVIGITAALSTGGDDKKSNDAQPTGAPSVGQSEQPSEAPSGEKDEQPADLPEQDAATLQLTPPAAAASDVPGAKGAGGAYVSLSGGPGAAAGWKVDIPKGGDYTLFVTYGVPGKDAKTSLFVNDQDRRSVNMKNFANAPAGAWDKGWTTTYAYIHLTKGSNSIKISCETGDQCDVNLDQLSLKAGQVKG